MYETFGILDLLYFQKRLKKEDMGIESSCTKAKLLIETLTEKVMTVADLRETNFE